MLLIYLISKSIYKNVEQNFLLSGYSYFTCDRDFALVKKRKRVGKMYTPENIEKMIAKARHQKSFNVIHVQKNDFKNFQIEAENYYSHFSLRRSLF